MVISRMLGRKALWIGPLLVALLLISGCSGLKPYEPRDHREEGPEKGLFTGSKGEFAIFRKAEEPKKESEDKQNPNEPESTPQPEPARDENE